MNDRHSSHLGKIARAGLMPTSATEPGARRKFSPNFFAPSSRDGHTDNRSLQPNQKGPRFGDERTKNFGIFVDALPATTISAVRAPLPWSPRQQHCATCDAEDLLAR
jgi:hypothetical protein